MSAPGGGQLVSGIRWHWWGQVLPQQQEKGFVWLRSASKCFFMLRLSACSNTDRRICAGSMSAPRGGQLVSGIRWHGWGQVLPKPKQQESLRSNSNYFEVILAASAKSDRNFFSTSGSMSAPGGGQLVSGIRWHGWGLVSCCCVMIFISLMLELWWALGSPLSSLWSGPGSSRRDMTLTALLLVTTHCSDLNQARPMTPRLKLQSEQLSTKYIDP